LKTYL